jgi:hypothetical protein
MLSATLTCLECGWQSTCGEDQIAQRLRRLGLLRRSAHPSEEMVRELLVANAGRLSCDGCSSVGIVLGTPTETEDEGDWQQAIVCQVCGQPIPPERTEVFPEARRCVGCQGVADRGEEPEEPEFCEKCGALVELRVSQAGGLTRYRRFCTGSPACRL